MSKWTLVNGLMNGTTVTVKGANGAVVGTIVGLTREGLTREGVEEGTCVGFNVKVFTANGKLVKVYVRTVD